MSTTRSTVVVSSPPVVYFPSDLLGEAEPNVKAVQDRRHMSQATLRFDSGVTFAVRRDLVCQTGGLS